jgi:beta-phosphoglucomutase-like phosphatase (HAD superfamily)
MGVLPAQTLVVEDGEAGIMAAKAGGFWVVGVGNPQVVKQAHLVVPDLSHLPLETLGARLSRLSQE